MEEPGRLQSVGSLGVGHDWPTSLSLFTFMHWRRKWQPTPVFLPGESQGRGSLVGCRLWGRTESDMTEWLSTAHSQLTNYVVIASGERQRYSAIHIHVPILPQAPLPSRLPHNIEQSSLCSVGTYWLSILTVCGNAESSPLAHLGSLPACFYILVFALCKAKYPPWSYDDWSRFINGSDHSSRDPTWWGCSYKPTKSTEKEDKQSCVIFKRVGHDWSDLACMHALEKEMATHSSVLAWRIPGTEEPGGLPSMGSHRVRHDWCNLAAAAAEEEKDKHKILASDCWGFRYCLHHLLVMCDPGQVLFLLFLLKYSWFTICVISGVCSKMIQIYIFFFNILFHYRLLQDIEYRSLCYRVGLCWLPILYIVVCVFQPQTPNLSLFPPPLWWPYVCCLYWWVCFCFVNIFICMIF